MKSLTDIQSKLQQSKALLFAKYPLRSLAIFGSYARKEQNENSDVDIMVDFEENIGIRFVDLADEIESILETKVDVVSRKGIKQKYFEAIKSDFIYV